MYQYMLIYLTKETWPVEGELFTQKCYFFNVGGSARIYMDHLRETYPDTLMEVQIYEYTGNEYALVERWHKDA